MEWRTDFCGAAVDGATAAAAVDLIGCCPAEESDSNHQTTKPMKKTRNVPAI